MSTKPISCDLHDYLEIACMYHYEVKLQLKNKQYLRGKALDVITLDQREYLVIENDKKEQVELAELDKLQVLTANAKFKEIQF